MARSPSLSRATSREYEVNRRISAIVRYSKWRFARRDWTFSRKRG